MELRLCEKDGNGKIPTNLENVESCLLNNSWCLLFVYSHAIRCVFMAKNWIVAALVTCQPSRLPFHSTQIAVCLLYLHAIVNSTHKAAVDLCYSTKWLAPRSLLFIRTSCIHNAEQFLHASPLLRLAFINWIRPSAALSFFALVYLVLMASLIVSPLLASDDSTICFSAAIALQRLVLSGIRPKSCRQLTLNFRVFWLHSHK